MSANPVGGSKSASEGVISQVEEKEDSQVIATKGRFKFLSCGKKDQAEIKEASKLAEEASESADAEASAEAPKAGKCKPLPTWGTIAIGVAVVAAVVLTVIAGAKGYDFFSNGGLDTLKNLARHSYEWMKNTALPAVSKFISAHPQMFPIAGGVAGSVAGGAVVIGGVVAAVALTVKAINYKRDADRVMGIAVDHIKDQDAQIEALNAEIDELRGPFDLKNPPPKPDKQDKPQVDLGQKTKSLAAEGYTFEE